MSFLYVKILFLAEIVYVKILFVAEINMYLHAVALLTMMMNILDLSVIKI